MLNMYKQSLEAIIPLLALLTELLIELSGSTLADHPKIRVHLMR